MISADPIKDMSRNLEKALDSRVEVIGNLYLVNKQRDLAIHSGDSSFSFKVGYEITFQDIHQQGMMLNKAEILLLPEELPIFSLALISHGASLPSNYSQHLIMEPNVYCLYMESCELPERFAERLAAALKAIDS